MDLSVQLSYFSLSVCSFIFGLLDCSTRWICVQIDHCHIIIYSGYHDSLNFHGNMIYSSLATRGFLVWVSLATRGFFP